MKLLLINKYDERGGSLKISFMLLNKWIACFSQYSRSEINSGSLKILEHFFINSKNFTENFGLVLLLILTQI